MTPPVAAAMFSFIEVPPGGHRAYNAFHQLDHLPEQYTIPGVVRGDRWVATPACVAARPAGTDEPFGAAQYLAVYLLAAPVEDALDGLRALAGRLTAAGRSFDRRRTWAFGGWHVTAAVAAPRALVSAEVVPWRPATGVHLILERADAPPLDLDALAGTDGVAGAWSFARERPYDGWADAPYRLTLAWLDGEPAETGRRIGTAGADAPVLSAAYETITPGQWDWFD